MGEDTGYGPGRLLTAEAVVHLDRALGTFSDETFRQRFDLEALEAAEIYPQIWDESLEELLEEYGWYFRQLKSFVGRAATQGQALVILMT